MLSLLVVGGLASLLGMIRKWSKMLNLSVWRRKAARTTLLPFPAQKHTGSPHVISTMVPPKQTERIF